MENPFDKIFQRLDAIQQQLDALEEALPKDTPIRRYSVKEIAENTPLGVQTIRSYIQNGKIKAQRLGNKYLITPGEFNRVCEEARSLKYRRD